MKWENPPDIFEWQVLPFGTTCSPCCTTFALPRHVKDHSVPEDGIRDSVECCFYVDNCLQSLSTAAEAKRLVDNLWEILASGGFEIRQWACNIPTVIAHLPKEARSDSMERWLSHDDTGLSESTHGLSWHWESDILGYKSRPLDYDTLTMRNVYKVLSRQYDPLGFILPYTTRAKLLVQSMWDKQHHWDDPLLPQELQQAWREWEAELHLLPRITLPKLMFQHMWIKPLSLDRSTYSVTLRRKPMAQFHTCVLRTLRAESSCRSWQRDQELLPDGDTQFHV